MPWSRSSAFGSQGVMPCYQGITYHPPMHPVMDEAVQAILGWTQIKTTILDLFLFLSHLVPQFEKTTHPPPPLIVAYLFFFFFFLCTLVVSSPTKGHCHRLISCLCVLHAHLGNQNHNHLPWELEPEKHTLNPKPKKLCMWPKKKKNLTKTKKLCVEIRTKKLTQKPKTKTKKAYPANPKLEKLCVWPKTQKAYPELENFTLGVTKN
jgi:hypothetical protein